MKMLGIVAVGVVRESRKFRAPIYMAHRAVIFATAQLSCITVCAECGSGSTAVTMTSKVNGKVENLTSCRSETAKKY